ncbi:glycosyltransferase family 2 protein [Pontibacter oryzae]|uniref:Glycosyltransferase family 2 protein n=1 Tax=Pontibacter oryzae TaxID=2304593 RepID=A0A399SF78_9BACT|nr:glycosyltransferase family 2 protein [Pontibacter oryzae]RIJ42776.1 glycosyltransferase family 2 protein [Pontibacter oryzae]
MKVEVYTPKISIIVPTFNRGNLISETIKSVIAQSYKFWELIVVDDGSSDNTKIIVNEFTQIDNRISYMQRPSDTPKGANACRNYGLQLASGEYVKWLDSDDLLDLNCLHIQLNGIQNGDATVNFCNAQFFKDSNGKIELLNKSWSDILTSVNITDDLVIGELKWQTACGLWKKSIFEDTSPFDERIHNSQEWLFNIKLSLNPSFRISVTNKNLIYIRTHIGSMSSAKNKSGKYFYHAAMARFYAYQLIGTRKFNRHVRTYLIRKFFRNHFFTLYKGYPKGFINLVAYWPRIIYLTIKAKTVTVQ